jgi:hypothetical protein
MKRYWASGGIFFNSENAGKLCEWYRERLGIAFSNRKSKMENGR